jgi:hypothetical protein
MNYLEDYIKEAEEIKTRFEESKELILCVGAENRLEQIANEKMICKYDLVIGSVVELRDLLVESEKRQKRLTTKTQRNYRKETKTSKPPPRRTRLRRKDAKESATADKL